MPYLIPTPEELQRIPRSKRLAIRRAALAILTATDDIVAKETEHAVTALEFGEAIRARAHLMESVMAWDRPDVIAERRRVALEATR